MVGQAGLTTHVLDTAHGCPAAGIPVRLFRLVDGADEVCVRQTLTNADGRCNRPLLEAGEMRPGHYRLQFEIARYFRDKGVTLSDPPFLDLVSIHFAIADDQAHYHVPLLVSPYGFSTYRGS